MASVQIVLDAGEQVVNYRLNNTSVEAGNEVLKMLHDAKGTTVLLTSATGETLLINTSRLVMAQVER